MSLSAIESQPRIARFVAAVALAHFLVVLAMMVSPQLHEAIHHDADEHDHECAVTDMLAGGAGDASFPQPIVIAEICPLQFCSVAEFEPQWVASLFLTSHVFEHAPPACA